MGSLEAMGVRGFDRGCPGPGGFYRWSGLGVVGVLVTSVRIGLGVWAVRGGLWGPLEDRLELRSECSGKVVRRYPMLSSV